MNDAPSMPTVSADSITPSNVGSEAELVKSATSTETGSIGPGGCRFFAIHQVPTRSAITRAAAAAIIFGVKRRGSGMSTPLSSSLPSAVTSSWVVS